MADQPGTKTFHINQSHYTNSLLESTNQAKRFAPSDRMNVVRTVDVPVTTVDEFAQKLDQPHRHFED